MKENLHDKMQFCFLDKNLQQKLFVETLEFAEFEKLIHTSQGTRYVDLFLFGHRNDFGQRSKTIVEFKPEVDDCGDILRQLNLYRSEFQQGTIYDAKVVLIVLKISIEQKNFFEANNISVKILDLENKKIIS